MLRRFVALFAFAVAFIASARASAAVIRDGAKFSVDLGGARVCWVVPIELRSQAECAGLTPENVPVPNDKGARTLAMGFVRLEEPGDPPDFAFVMVVFAPTSPMFDIDHERAREFTRDAHREVTKALPAGLRLLPASEPEIVRPQKLPLIRFELDVDVPEGVEEDSTNRILEHHVHYAAAARDGYYSVSWLTRRRSENAVERLADDAAASITVANPPTSRKALMRQAGVLVGAIFGFGSLVMIAVIGIVLALVMRKPQAPPPAVDVRPAWWESPS